MSDDNAPQMPQPDPALNSLDRLVGTWDIEGNLRRFRPLTGAEVPATAPGMVSPLTARETEVLALIAAGRPNQQNRRRTVRHTGHGEEAPEPHLHQARGDQPHRRSRPCA